MRLNASGVRDTARSLHICPNTVLRELKKKETALESVNTSLLRTLNPDEVAWDLERAGEAEMDEMWSFVGHKGNPRWLWHAIDHHTGKVLAYVFGRRQDSVFLGSVSKVEIDANNVLQIKGLGAVVSTFDTPPKLRRLPRFHLFNIGCVNAEHAVDVNILPIDRQPVLLRHALGLRRTDDDLDATLGIEREAGVLALMPGHLL